MFTDKWCLLLLTCAFQHFGSASDIKCSCAHDGDKTKCVIAEESRISDPSNCSFSWSDADANSVLANEAGKNPELVESYDINELVTFKHLNKMAFSRHCPSENPKCTESCSINSTEIPSGPAKQEVPGPTDPTVPPASTPTNGTAKGGDSSYKQMIAVIAVAVPVTVLAVVIVVVLCYYRERIRRTQCWIKLSSIWTRVSTQADDHRAAGDVEMGIM